MLSETMSPTVMLVAALTMAWPMATARGWGAEGHRITGYVADGRLTPRTRAALRQILGDFDLAELTLEADVRRAELSRVYAGSERWHYDDRLVCHPDLSAEDYCPQGN